MSISEKDLLWDRRRELLKMILKARRNIKEADDNRLHTLLVKFQANLIAAEIELTKVDNQLGDDLLGYEGAPA